MSTIILSDKITDDFFIFLFLHFTLFHNVLNFKLHGEKNLSLHLKSKKREQVDNNNKYKHRKLWKPMYQDVKNG